MAVTVLISATLRSFASHNAILELEGSSVEEALNILIDVCSGLQIFMRQRSAH